MKMKSNYLAGRPFYLFVLILMSVSSVFAAPGDLDTGFNPWVSNNGNSERVNVIEKLPGGKYLVGGKFIKINGIATAGLARLNADLTFDASFDPPELVDLNYTGEVIGLGIQSDGKIIVLTQISLAESIVRRLLPNGTLDPTFQTFSPPPAKDVVILPGDKILVGGWLYFANGTRDNSFPGLVSGGHAAAFQPDGRILAGTVAYRRYNPDGAVDNAYQIVNANSTIQTIVALPDGKSMIGGSFSTVNGFPVGRIARIGADGTPDLTFNQGFSGFDGEVSKIIVKPDGKLLIAGFFTTYNAVPRARLAQLNPDGTLDNSFQLPDLSSMGGARDIEILPNGKFLVGFANTNSVTSPLRIFNADGTADAPLNLLFGRGGVNKILQQPDGKILIFGGFTIVNGTARNWAARLNPDGSLDPTFVPDVTFGASGITTAALQADGKIVVAGGNLLARLNPDGSRDPSLTSNFSVRVIIEQVALQPDGKILALIGPGVRRLLRFNADGTEDTTFNVPGINDSILTFALQPDGKIVIAGAFTMVNSVSRNRIARLNPDGTLDDSFFPPGGANHLVWKAEVEANGKIVLSGSFTGLNGSTNQNRIGRLNADGTLDASFVQTQAIADVFGGFGMKVQPDGKILLWGAFDAVGTTPRTGIARFNADGSLDPTFNPLVNKAAYPGGAVSDVYLQTDGKILLGGSFTRVNGVSRAGIARLLNTSTPARTFFDYDGDGRADISVFRPSENKWFILRSSDLGITQTIFAVAGDAPVPADYDGDGKTDLAVFRPASGAWWYLSSINNAQINVNFGQNGDIPRPSDFDGDGRADFVLFRPSNGSWYRLSATGQTSIVNFGIAEDKPLIGDWDGDGKSDPAVFRPSTGDWWYASSITGQFITVHWGASGDVPVPGDYDADGKTDFVVFRPSDGGWYILYSTGSYTIATFGTVGDKPVAADYDGDGKWDIGVFRPSTGTWYLLQTTAGFGAAQFGNAGDVPTENAFLP